MTEYFRRLTVHVRNVQKLISHYPNSFSTVAEKKNSREQNVPEKLQTVPQFEHFFVFQR
jgi:hypothetical protein